MHETWSRTSANPAIDTAEQAIAARLLKHGIVSDRAIVTGYVVTAETATFDIDGTVVEHCSWIPSANLSLDAQISMLERTLEALRREQRAAS
ncbi:hypothetical protein ACWEOE_31885 [Amycolatopsis sp. NPDC004368]